MSGQQQPQPPSVPPVQPQPFRFWLPYRSNVGSWRQQPRPMPASTRPQQPGGAGPPPPAPAEPAPPARPVEEDVPIHGDSSDESGSIPVEALDSLRSRGAREIVADLELTLSRSPARVQGQGTDGDGDAKISISGFPRTRLFEGARAPYRREIEDGLKSLAGRETPPTPRPPDQGYRVITLAGHNVGASMVLGNGPGGTPPPRTANEPEGSPAWPSPSVAANVNSNVQGVNNSTMEESTCSSGDPGVRVDIKNAHDKPHALAPSKEEEKPKESARTLPPQEKSTAARGSEAAPAPPKAKRCLRALMIEERKPKPIACRFQCVADHAPPPAATASDPGGQSTVEGAEERTS